MIILLFGQVGSGKTLSMVREMIENPQKIYYTNIEMKGKYKHIIKITADMVVRKEIIGYKRDGTEVKKLHLNLDYWQEIINKGQSINIVIDEFQNLINARRSGSKINILMGDFAALIRRVCSDSEGRGNFYGISQISRRLDVIYKEMATEIRWHRCIYMRNCLTCNYSFMETNESSIKPEKCPACLSPHLKRKFMKIEIYYFKNIDMFEAFFHGGHKSYYRRLLFHDVDRYFNKYNTFQIQDLLSQFY